MRTIDIATFASPSSFASVRSEHVLVVKGRRYGVGAVMRGGSARQVDHGPLVPGPWAYVYELCTVIDNHGGTGAMAQRNRAAGIEHDVAPGDIVRIDGCEYAVCITERYTQRHGNAGTVYLEPIA